MLILAILDLPNIYINIISIVLNACALMVYK